jgi:hypothetical protein
MERQDWSGVVRLGGVRKGRDRIETEWQERSGSSWTRTAGLGLERQDWIGWDRRGQAGTGL